MSAEIAPVQDWTPGDAHAFDHGKAVFEQSCQQFRHLNEQMNRIPPFAVTLTGGFWYLAFATGHRSGLDGDLDTLARFALMIFAGICDFALVGIAIRVRDVMAEYQARMDRFEGPTWAPHPATGARFPRYTMISMYSILIMAAGVLSWVGALALFRPARLLTLGQGIGTVAAVVVLIVVASYLAPRWLSR